MGSSSSATPATSSPPASSGGTAPPSNQFAPFDEIPMILHDRNSCESLRSASNDALTTIASSNDTLAQNMNIEQDVSFSNDSSCSVVTSPGSSPDTTTKCSSCFSSSIGSTALQSIDERHAQVAVDSSNISPERMRQVSSVRLRELSAPLPAVPPTTPSSTIVHRTCLSQPHNLASIPAPIALHSTPLSNFTSVFNSPLVDHFSDQDGEISDSNSVEIISGYASDSVAIHRSSGREGMTISQDFIESTRIHENRSVTPALIIAPRGAESNDSCVSNFKATASSSITPTPHSNSNSNSNNSSRSLLSDGIYDTAPSEIISSFTPASELSFTSQPQSAGHKLGNATDTPSSVHQHNTDSGISLVESPDSPSQGSKDVIRTPNVYINGLPPHFPDESLYLMTREFGHVLSVRTFTRCVGEKMSGYGFVLYDNVDSAERCIETLRKYRNLHPSFSKQVHKIPGTPYASGIITLPPAGSVPSLSSQSTLSSVSSFPSMASSLVSTESGNTGDSPLKIRNHHTSDSISTISGSDLSYKESRDMSFREKMEKLKDSKSTNLYMEGLPLTIDDVSLAALVSPHKIVSSRFFQTKLSNPPRMIAFVRLETRPAAEEVIERLHGRVVRGWNDNGCRISVRFADSNEQRELRRTERMARGDEEEIGTATRLSMAQAALINLRGAEAHTHIGTRSRSQFPPTGDSFRNAITGVELGRVVSQGQTHQTISPDKLMRNRHALGLSTQMNGVLSLDQVPLSSNALTTEYSESLIGTGASIASMKTLDANRLALLQQQTQLQQLQLLQQMRGMTSGQHWQTIDHGYSNDFSRTQPQSLMPSIDIVSDQACDMIPELSSNYKLSSQVSQAMMRKHSLHDSTNKKISPDIPSVTVLRNDEGFDCNRRTVDHDDVLRNRRADYDLNYSSTSLYTNTASRLAGINRNDRLAGNGRHHITIQEESEIPNVSPALTYASRSPASLSPSTPLFNTFVTPASAPATVPQSKPILRERERVYRQ